MTFSIPTISIIIKPINLKIIQHRSLPICFLLCAQLSCELQICSGMNREIFVTLVTCTNGQRWGSRKEIFCPQSKLCENETCLQMHWDALAAYSQSVSNPTRHNTTTRQGKIKWPVAGEGSRKCWYLELILFLVSLLSRRGFYFVHCAALFTFISFSFDIPDWWWWWWMNVTFSASSRWPVRARSVKGGTSPIRLTS